MVWNENYKQPEIATALAENGADVDSLDENRRTPLHYASEGAKTKVIPILLQYGAKISIRDGEKKMTAYQLAPNERIRELLIVYSSPPYHTKPEDIDYLNEALKGQKLLIRVSGEPKKLAAAAGPKPFTKSGKGSTAKKPKPIEEKSPEEEDQEEQKSEKQDESTESHLPYNIRGYQAALISFLQRVQDFGVASYQHVKKPYLFSGSWMEQVRSLDDLMKIIGSASSTDSVMRVFNVLHPYKKPLPPPKGDEVAISEFYGEKAKEEAPAAGASINLRAPAATEVVPPSPGKAPQGETAHAAALSEEFDVEKKKREDEERTAYVKRLENELRLKDARIQVLEARRSVESSSAADASNGLAQERSLREATEKRVQELTAELQKSQGQIEELQGILDKTNHEYLELKSQLEAPGQADLEAARKRISDLERQLESQRQTDKALRFKAGQMFISALDEAKRKPDDDTGAKMHLGGGIGIENFNPEDDYALIRMLKKLEDNPPSLHQRLVNADATGTGILSLSQFTKVLNEAKIPPQDVISMMRIARVFDQGSGRLRVKDFMAHLASRAELREKWEKELFTKVLSYFRQMKLSLADAFAFFDTDKSGMIQIEEMEAGFNTMKIRLPRQDLKAIFAVMDKDNSGSISLEELSERLTAMGGNLPASATVPEEKKATETVKSEAEAKAPAPEEPELPGLNEDLPAAGPDAEDNLEGVGEQMVAEPVAENIVVVDPEDKVDINNDSLNPAGTNAENEQPEEMKKEEKKEMKKEVKKVGEEVKTEEKKEEEKVEKEEKEEKMTVVQMMPSETEKVDEVPTTKKAVPAAILAPEVKSLEDKKEEEVAEEIGQNEENSPGKAEDKALNEDIQDLIQ